MKIEYILFNLAIISGPVLSSFDKKLNYFSKWIAALVSIFIIIVPFIIWDKMVTGKHWWFNDKYTLDFRLAGLPFGEVLFFITVPFACLFIWEILSYYHISDKMHKLFFITRVFFLLCFPIGIILFIIGKEYTGLVFTAIFLTSVVDWVLKINILLQSRTYLFLAFVTIFISFFNGYLTSRPIVLYDLSYQLDLRIGTIPIEDFFYGYSLLLLCVIVFEKIKKVKYG